MHRVSTLSDVPSAVGQDRGRSKARRDTDACSIEWIRQRADTAIAENARRVSKKKKRETGISHFKGLFYNLV